MDAISGERIVLARKENSMIRYRWTGAQPPGLRDLEVAEELGAIWEGPELVTYDLPGLTELLEYYEGDEYLSDND